MQCKVCGNTQRFITERRIWCWVEVDGDGTCLGHEVMQGVPFDRPGADESMPGAHVECFECNSEDVDKGV